MLCHKDPSVTLMIYADLFDSDLDAVAVNLDVKISDNVKSVSKAPTDRRRKRRKMSSSCDDVSGCCVSEGGLEPPRPLIGH